MFFFRENRDKGGLMTITFSPVPLTGLLAGQAGSAASLATVADEIFEKPGVLQAVALDSHYLFERFIALQKGHASARTLKKAAVSLHEIVNPELLRRLVLETVKQLEENIDYQSLLLADVLDKKNRLKLSPSERKYWVGVKRELIAISKKKLAFLIPLERFLKTGRGDFIWILNVAKLGLSENRFRLQVCADLCQALQETANRLARLKNIRLCIEAINPDGKVSEFVSYLRVIRGT